MKEIDELRERVQQLELMHRVLTSQHLALFETCRVMLPLIPHPPDELQRKLVSIYDASNEQMEKSGYDEGFQTFVRGWFDELAQAILTQAEKRRHEQSPGD